MSNGITTASGEVVVRGEAEERGSLGVCVMLEYKWKREEDGDLRWGEKGHHLENVESEAHVDSNICTEWFQFMAIYLTERKKAHFLRNYHGNGDAIQEQNFACAADKVWTEFEQVVKLHMTVKGMGAGKRVMWERVESKENVKPMSGKVSSL